MKGKHFITPDDDAWVLPDEERTYVEPHPYCDGWYIVVNGAGVEMALHRDEIELLCKAITEYGDGG